LGLLKSSASTWFQVPVVRDVASVLYWKSSRSAVPRFVTPARHISPVYAIASEVIVPPVAFASAAPIVGVNDPLWRPPKARSGLPAAPKLYVSPVLPLPVPAL